MAFEGEAGKWSLPPEIETWLQVEGSDQGSQSRVCEDARKAIDYDAFLASGDQERRKLHQTP